MQTALSLLQNLLPLYLIMALGFWLGKTLQISARPIARILIFSITPAVVFLAVLNVPASRDPLIITLVTLSIAFTLCLVSLPFLIRRLPKGLGRLSALALGTGNTGYFGIPLCTILFGPEGGALAVFAAMGQTLYENTLGYYVLCRHEAQMREALFRVLKLPAVHAIVMALILRSLDLESPALLTKSLELLKGAYAPLGMMLIGLALAETSSLSQPDDLAFSLGLTLAKPLLWLSLMGTFLLLEATYFPFLNSLTRQVLWIQASVPIAANTAAFAQETGVEPGKAALAVTMATLGGLLIVPLAAALLPF